MWRLFVDGSPFERGAISVKWKLVTNMRWTWYAFSSRRPREHAQRLLLIDVDVHRLPCLNSLAYAVCATFTHGVLFSGLRYICPARRSLSNHQTFCPHMSCVLDATKAHDWSKSLSLCLGPGGLFVPPHFLPQHTTSAPCFSLRRLCSRFAHLVCSSTALGSRAPP